MIKSKNIKVKYEIQFLKPLRFNNYNVLKINAMAVLSDRGNTFKDSSILNFRALNSRVAHERQEAMDQTSVMMVVLNPEKILQGLKELENQKIGELRNYHTVADYSIPNVLNKVIRLTISYSDYVKK